MIQQLIQHLDSLQVDLSVIDPMNDFDAADRVAAIVLALRRAVDEPARLAIQADRAEPARASREAA